MQGKNEGGREKGREGGREGGKDVRSFRGEWIDRGKE